MRRTALTATVALVLTGMPIAGVPAAPTATAITAMTGAPDPGGTRVTGSATFGGQDPVEVADDPANDVNLTPTIGDRQGVEPGVDLLTASLSVPAPASPELLVSWQVANLPDSGMMPEVVRYAFPFKVGGAVYLVQAKFSNLTDPELAGDPEGHTDHVSHAFELRGSCTASVQGTGIAHCSHLAWLEGSADPVSGTITARVPLGSAAAPGLVPGATIRRNDSTNPDLNDIIAGYGVASTTPSLPIDDRASFGPPQASSFSYQIPQRVVALGVAPSGTDPREVSYETAAAVAADGSFSGVAPTIGMAPGTHDVYARACFASNCGYRSLGGASLALGDVVAALSVPKPGETDRSFVFWEGANVGDRVFHTLPLIGAASTCATAPCYTYKLRVDTPGAARLRVALDASMRNDGFFLQVTRPTGATSSATNSNAFNSELFLPDPETGIYTILVRPASTENSEFALRAKLEGTLPVRVPDANGLLPPNMRPTAPYELGFAAPINPLNGPFLAPDDANPPYAVGGHATVSCSPDETADDQAIRCLRFSFGLANTGPGNFDIRGAGSSDPGGAPRPLVQCVERADGGPMARPSGTAAFHSTHLHNHFNDLIRAELLRVTDPATGAMTPVGTGRKLGYSPADQSLADWSAFDQAAPGTSGSAGTCQAGASTLFGLSIGWGDVYRYQRAGNFVNFGLNPDGHYVVRLRIDPLNNVLESNENDNVSYTYVRVTLDQVQILEYGRGLSPWDPNKQVLQLRRKAGVPW